jgi:hypothetical protein
MRIGCEFEVERNSFTTRGPHFYVGFGLLLAKTKSNFYDLILQKHYDCFIRLKPLSFGWNGKFKWPRVKS